MQFFGSKKGQAPPPQEKTLNTMTKEELRDKQRGLQKQLQREMREIDKQAFQIDMQRKKAEESLQKEIKKGDKSDKFIKQTYAKQVVTCQKQKERCLANKGKVQGVMYSMDNMFANIKMAQAMGCMSQVMKDINKAMNIKEISQSMQEMQKEMMKMGIVQEQMDEAMENMNDDVELGDMQEEADKLILDIEKNLAGPAKNLPEQQQKQQQMKQDQFGELDDMEKKLQAL